MHNIDFFRDEIRNGFYIPTAIKQSWAAGLDVLSEIDRICEKYDITYYADWGSFLGAVRHGGFIPWDDDLDICMRRDDYERFREVADKELPDHFTIHDYKSKEDHWLFLARVVNNKVMCFEEKYLKEHNNYPWLTGVDIFLKDYLYKNPKTEKKRDEEIMNILALADGITEGKISRVSAGKHIRDIEEGYGVRIPFDNDRETSIALYELAERIMSQVSKEDTDTLGQIFPWILKGQEGEPTLHYEKTVRLPFEDTTIPVPAWYNTVLKRRYGEYHKIYKKWDAHDYPAFEGQVADMERLLGEKMPSFKYDEGMQKRPDVDKSSSFRTLVKEALEEIHSLISAKDNDSLQERLSAAQQLAVDMGNLTEEVRGEDDPHTIPVIKALQDLCDCIYNDHNSEELKSVPEALDKVSSVIEEHILSRKEVLFLPIGFKEWETMSDLVGLYGDEDTDVSILPLPLLRKDYYGNILMSDEEIKGASHMEKYPTHLKLSDWMTYSVKLHAPDVIYIQDVYDNWNPVLTIPPDFYAVNLRNYTEELIYVPIGKTGEFSKDDEKDIYNLKHYVTAPGVVYADKVIVQSDNIKERYIEALTKFAGKKTKGIWEGKITTRSLILPGRHEEPLKESDGKKRLLFCIGANELSEHRETLVPAVKERLEIIKESLDRLDVTIAPYPFDRKQWEKVDKDLSGELFKMVDGAVSDGFSLLEIIPLESEDTVTGFDAFYGDMCPLVITFIEQGKPVMLCNYDIDVL